MISSITTEKFLLLKITEECSELSQRASKAFMFGLQEVQKGQELTNLDRLKNELHDLLHTIKMLEQLNGVNLLTTQYEDYQEKLHKYEEFNLLSEELGEVVLLDSKLGDKV